jgi:hypothetical protein
MGDPRVASPILRRPARFGLAASDRGYAGCELRRIPLLGTWLNKAHSGRIEPPAPAINTVALDGLDGSAYTLQAIFASIREKDYVSFWWLWGIVDYKRGRASAAKEQPHREVGTQSHGPRL